jgi:hypothetical protein
VAVAFEAIDWVRDSFGARSSMPDHGAVVEFVFDR